MIYLLLISSFVIIAYGIIITLSIIGFNRLRYNQANIPNDYDYSSSIFISVVISARNESQNIIKCLEQFEKQNFAKNLFEIIVIDDSSEDNTDALSQNFLEQTNIIHQVIKMQTHQGKKRCLTQAINLAKGNIIVTSDADVIYRHHNFLKTIAYYFETNEPAMLVMPIDYESNQNILTNFQITENIALTGITAGFVGVNKPFLCNGANLAFDKKAFMTVNGYDSHAHISSGEDVFLLEDLKKEYTSRSIQYGFYRELIAKTIPEISLYNFVNQRTRWAQKSKFNPNKINLLVGLVVLLANILILILPFVFIQKSIFINYFVTFTLAKIIFDFLLVFITADFLGKIKYIKFILPFQLVYWIYAILIGFSSLIIRPLWKDKKVN